VTRQFIVIEPDAIVLMDLVGMLTFQFPDALVHPATSLAAANAVEIDRQAKLCLIASVNPVQLATSDVARNVRRAGGKIILTTNHTISGTNELPVTWVEKPFTTQIMLQAVTCCASV
jgi:DNA-binding MurR/RpiR family transcriptional regulator